MNTGKNIIKSNDFITTFLKKQTVLARIRTFLKDGNRRDREDIWKPIQYGGSIVKHEGFEFRYDNFDDTIIGYSKKKKQCFTIIFEEEVRNIVIDISFYKDCCHNKDILIILNAALLLIFKNKNLNMYKTIGITDNSGKSIKSYENDKLKMVDLPNMYFICTGCTWYSSLAPMFLKDRVRHRKYISDRKHIVGAYSLSWNNLLDKLENPIKRQLENILDELNIKIGTIDKNLPDSASKILNIIRDDKTFSIIFYKYMDDLLKAFDVSSLYAREWAILIEDGRIIASRQEEIQNQCKNKKGWIIPDEFIKYVSVEEYNNMRESVQV